MPKDVIKANTTRIKMSESAKKRIRFPTTEETKNKISESNKRKYLLDPTRSKRVSGKNKGHIVSEETRKKISEAVKKYYATIPGAIQKNRETQKREYSLNPEHRLKVGIKSRERGKDPKYKTKLSILQKKRWEISPEQWFQNRWYGDITYYENPQYCEKFNKDFKERVRAFRGYVCFECGAPQTRRKLHVHHVHYDKKMCCNGSPQDIIPLCHSCHIRSNYNRDYWEDHFTELIYLLDPEGKCFFTKQEMKTFFNNTTVTTNHYIPVLTN